MRVARNAMVAPIKMEEKAISRGLVRSGVIDALVVVG